MKFITLCMALVVAGALPYSAYSQVGNFFAGFQTGQGNTGSYNAFVGYQSGVSSNTGWYNSFYGYQSGFLNRGGSYNVFIGSFAGYDNTSGLSNTFIGWAAGSNNTTASSNSFYGNLSGYQNSTGSSNAFFGSATAYSNTTGSYNTFLGTRSGYYNTTASNNTFIGFSAGEKNTTGTLNTFIGTQAGFATTTAHSNTFVGAETGIVNSTGYRNVFVGTNAGQKTTTGGENTFIGRYAGVNNTTGLGNSSLGHSAGPSSSGLKNATAIGNRAYVSVSNAVVLGSVSGVNGASTTARVGIGTTAPGYLLHVNGVAAKPGGGSWTVASDKRLKKDIQSFDEGLAEIMQVRPVWFRYNGKAGLPTDKRFVGVIAQEMQKVAPHTVGEFIYEAEEGVQERYLDYDANALSYMLVNAVKELNLLSQQQAEEIRKLRAELDALRSGSDNKTLATSARLWQNFPNPYGASTIIRYYVPEEVGSAELRVISSAGQEVYTVTLPHRGEGEVEISNQIISAGQYVYQLIVDGNIVDNRKMIYSK